jgi:hypothetical protein
MRRSIGGRTGRRSRRRGGRQPGGQGRRQGRASEADRGRPGDGRRTRKGRRPGAVPGSKIPSSRGDLCRVGVRPVRPSDSPAVARGLLPSPGSCITGRRSRQGLRRHCAGMRTRVGRGHSQMRRLSGRRRRRGPDRHANTQAKTAGGAARRSNAEDPRGSSRGGKPIEGESVPLC